MVLFRINPLDFYERGEIKIDNIYVKLLKKVMNFVVDTFYAVSIISMSVLAILNITSVYKYVIDRYELTKYTGLSADILMDNYKRTIYYVQNPFIKELNFNSLTMSDFGRIHFYEVKRIFIALYVFMIAFIIIMIIKVFTNRNNDLSKKLIKRLNSSGNIIALIFIAVSAVALVDFSKAFVFFHKIFFSNDYWIFDPKIDPIINALPEELFMIEFILIVALLILFTVAIKVFNFKLKNKVTFRRQKDKYR